MVNYPDPKIIEIFSSLFKIFQDIPDSCKKAAFAAIEIKKFGLCERILMAPSSKAMSQENTISEEEEQVGMYMICKGEVMVLKNEKMYSKFIQNEENFAKER